jgi:hypothetical protein
VVATRAGPKNLVVIPIFFYYFFGVHYVIFKVLFEVTFYWRCFYRRIIQN